MHCVFRHDIENSIVLVCWTFETLSPLRRIVKQILGLQEKQMLERLDD